MSTYEDIHEAAADNYGLVTRDEAAAIGVSDKELSRLTSDGRLTRIGHRQQLYCLQIRYEFQL